MPPKRKAAAKAKAPASKKAKKAAVKEVEEEEEDAGESSIKDAMEALKKADKGKKKNAQPDKLCPIAAQSAVVEEYDCMLNQTNIGANNNKYYIIQVLNRGGMYYSWNRWGRVGESGQNALKPNSLDGAIADFKKKFKDKTKNSWDERDNFQAVPGKYTLIEMGDEEESEADVATKAAKLDELDGVKTVTAKCTLDNPTQGLVKLIFDNDMFKEAMKSFDIDVKKMPLGKLSKAQIAKGFEVLEEIDDALKNKKHVDLNQLTSRFYTLIPHDFGRQRPPPIADVETVRKKMDMLLVLADIELAQAMQKDKETTAVTETKEVLHPLDVNYKLLMCDLEHLDTKHKDYKVIEKYLTATEGGWRKLKIKNVWKVNRYGEGDKFAAHEKTGNRKLLWHGTNVAVVAAILKSGLRIMPHSGGRVGRGIYFASENSKSAGYVRCAGHNGIMFLNEVVLGKEHHISMDNWTLTQAPKGYDCIIAKGRTEPDPKKDTSINIEGNKVVVPQGNPIPQPAFNNSSFSQSEYLIYKENQCRIRYLLQLHFN